MKYALTAELSRISVLYIPDLIILSSHFILRIENWNIHVGNTYWFLKTKRISLIYLIFFYSWLITINHFIVRQFLMKSSIKSNKIVSPI